MDTVTEPNNQPPEKRVLPPWLLGLVIALVIFGVGLLVANALGFGDDPTFDDSGSATSSTDTDGLVISYFDGSEGDFGDFRGAPLVINFWASWCPACVAELPDFAEVHRQFGEEVQFLGVNLTESDRGAAEGLIAKAGVTYTLAHDPDGILYASFAGIAMPTTVFIDSEGNVVDTHSGAIFAADLEERLREVFDL